MYRSIYLGLSRFVRNIAAHSISALRIVRPGLNNSFNMSSTEGIAMSWNTSVLLAERKSLVDMEQVIPDVFSVTKRTVVWEEASSAALKQNIAHVSPSSARVLQAVL
jgi:hypothetical protein